ncbi:hypothetical protein GLOTRDRAFT_59735 [Gloeophyllum trabeum ATCC 11539]|uniref:Symplekin n=1 Tax=Gloeophyllum trabeum (strain ATCC 11539 / FP-39264 / Madison 617) TaxID=670483 RepID=S7QAP5_GLOTA|nr:uncharacterized protein GLOTRDRAFT_59735 [Gloeophyllum trabeum ATCC 11539]EPQ56463.1 hypothetical protein GLOTRDRAFT_59735 [Gloeophyllum trabeum ATCC 11539]
MAGNPVDPLQTLSAALAVPPDSKEQAELLATLRESLEAYPGPIPILCKTLIRTLSGAGDSVLKRWVLDLLHFAICRSNLSVEVRTDLASQSVETLAGLLNDPNPNSVKLVVQCFATVYPLLFRVLCTNRNLRQMWDVLSQAKARILDFVRAAGVPMGIKLASVKFMQRVILVQTRGVADPRLQNKNDPNLAMCPSDHPFIPVAALEAEGVKLLEGIITMLYTSSNPDILSAILNSWANLVKNRPGPLVQIVVTALTQWTPNALAGQPASSIKSVEKAVRILLIHISRTPQGAPYVGQINEALAVQGARMDRAAAEEKARKAAAAEASRKRPASVPQESPPDSKRVKLEPDQNAAAAAAFLASFDFTTLPTTLINDLIIANLYAFPEPALQALVLTYRDTRRPSAPAAAPAPVAAPVASAPVVPPNAPPPSASVAGPPTAPAAAVAPTEKKAATPVPSAPPPVKEEPVDPLQMDIDEEEMEYEPDKLNLELSAGEHADAEDGDMGVPEAIDIDLLTELKLPPPKVWSEEDRDALIGSSMSRIREGVDVVSPGDDTTVNPSKMVATDLWMLLIIRMVTRVVECPKPGKDTEAGAGEDSKDDVELFARQERLRQRLCDYIMANFSARVRLATTWMNEEWYNDRIRSADDPDWRPNYDIWLSQILAAYQTHMDARDRTFTRFLLDLPSIPPDVLEMLRELCLDSERMTVGFTTLREFVLQRPTLRYEAINVLLELTTHSEKLIRGAAINTVKRWVPDVQPMGDMVRAFALHILRRLQSRAPKEKQADEDIAMNGEGENMEDGQLPAEDLVQTPYLPEELDSPVQRAQVLQHVELLFALSVKSPDLLDEIFTAYGQMERPVQETVQELITPLIRSLGSSHGKLLTLLRTFPSGAESLALRVLTIFTEHGRPSPQLVALVKGLITERDLNAKFLIPIIAEMDKADIVRHLPRIVSILNGNTEEKNLVRSVFSAIVTTPPETFGTVTSNLPRVRQSELLTPAELMVLLHSAEKEIGLKAAIEAIGICFSMTDVFRSEILAVVMQQIVDQPVLPTLFLRTVIQAVTTYKSLVGFVSTTLLSRLITKKIWTNPPLWEGFIRCAKIIAPSSFGALLQLPKDQLRDLVEKQPSLKAGLRDYVMKKAGNKAQKAGYLDFLGDDTSSQQPQAVAPSPA